MNGSPIESLYRRHPWTLLSMSNDLHSNAVSRTHRSAHASTWTLLIVMTGRLDMRIFGTRKYNELKFWMSQPAMYKKWKTFVSRWQEKLNRFITEKNNLEELHYGPYMIVHNLYLDALCVLQLYFIKYLQSIKMLINNGNSMFNWHFVTQIYFLYQNKRK